MRDLRRYPVTTMEICQCLNKLSDEISKVERAGDMRPLLLKKAAQIIDRLGFVTFDIAELP